MRDGYAPEQGAERNSIPPHREADWTQTGLAPSTRNTPGRPLMTVRQAGLALPLLLCTILARTGLVASSSMASDERRAFVMTANPTGDDRQRAHRKISIGLKKVVYFCDDIVNDASHERMVQSEPGLG